jgi:MYND finger
MNSNSNTTYAIMRKDSSHTQDDNDDEALVQKPSHKDRPSSKSSGQSFCSTTARETLVDKPPSVAIGGSSRSSTNDPVVCPSCGKQEATLLCTRCRMQRYCSRECQKADWKKSHKQQCTSNSTTTTTTTTLSPKGGGDSSNHPTGRGRIVLVKLQHSGDEGPATTKNNSKSPPGGGENVGGGGGDVCFPLKIQVALHSPIGVAPMMCYNESRSVQCLIHKQNCTKAQLLEKTIRQRGEMGGAKAFFNASLRQKDGALAIEIDHSLGLLPW